MLFSTLRERIFITLSVTVIFISIVVSSYLINSMERRLFDVFDSVNQTINKALVVNVRGYIYNRDFTSLQTVINSIESQYIKTIVIVDERGRVLVQRESRYRRGEKYPYIDLLLSSENKAIKTEQQYLVLNTFELLGVPLGYLVVEGNTDYYEEVLEEEKSTLLLFTLGVVIWILMVSFYLASSISRPVREMVQRLQAVKKDQLLGLDTFSEEEFRYLALTIQDKHNALVQLSEQLEDEVERKTKELQELNETLEEKVRDAVNDLQLKEQLLQQQSRFAQMGEMLSMIAHQWRQPLGAISASTVGIQTKMALKKYDMEEASDREKFESYLTKKLEAIQEYVRLLSDTIEDFRKFFRHEKERKVLQINEPIERVLHILESLIEKNSITIVKTLQSEKKLAVLQNEFMQVVMNILTNASDALVENREERREVSIHTYDTEESVVVEICDNGGGISEEIVGKVFDPYFSTKDEKNGTGLGLYMSKLIIEEHHDAMLRVNSEGEHSCFMIKFLIDKKVQGTA